MRDIIAKLIGNIRHYELNEVNDQYISIDNQNAIADIQLERFNNIWVRSCKSIPFYKKWKYLHNLPEKLNHINELDSFPVLTKNIISENKNIIFQTPNIERSTLTGGTSGLSTRFPMNKFDAKTAWINTHLGRKWNGIYPGDRLLMIWGHSHLFGNKNIFRKKLVRKIKDYFLNIERVSAYDLNKKKLENIYSKLISFKPKYIIGYGSCLDQFSSFLINNDLNLRDIGVLRIVNTSESISKNSEAKLKKLFNCPVINEYGMAEAGVIGYSIGNIFPIKIFWREFIIKENNNKIFLTTIGNRCFPLINYDTEDLGETINKKYKSLLHIDELKGKARDIFKIKDLNEKYCEVSVVLFDHIFKQIPEIKSVHYKLESDGSLNIKYSTFHKPLETKFLQDFLADKLKMENIIIDPMSTKFQFIKSPLQTIAGKRVKIQK